MFRTAIAILVPVVVVGCSVSPAENIQSTQRIEQPLGIPCGTGTCCPGVSAVAPHDPCDAAKPFRRPVKLADFGEGSGAATLSLDERTIYIVREHTLLRADRAGLRQPFSEPQAVSSFKGLTVGGVAVSADGLALYYSVENPEFPGVFILHVTKRGCTAEEFIPGIIAGNPYPDSPIQTDDNGLSLVDGAIYTSNAYAWTTTSAAWRWNTQSWQVALVSEVKFGERWAAPAVDHDESHLYMFHIPEQTKPAHILKFRNDPRLDPETSPPAERIPEVDNPTEIDAPLWVSHDKCRLYLRRDYASDRTNQGIFVAKRGL